ncbi:MAG: hypothetical protein IT436_13980 [Phycisphaerales bacterium]|nr:hypothetical protein [Phycisphaerales bacterium]
MTVAAAGHSPVTDLVWPVERFYWAQLDAPGYRRAGALPPGLLALLADEIPQPIEEVFAVGIPVGGGGTGGGAGGGRVLVCAVQRETLAALPPTVGVLRPDGPPPGVEPVPGLQTLNLLVGEFEPAPVRRERYRRHVSWAGILMLVATLAVVGLARRASHWRSIAVAAETAQRQVVAQVFGESLPPEHAVLSLDAELDRLREINRSKPMQPVDASTRLVALLKAWPSGVPSKPQGVGVNESGITVSVAVDGDPAPFLSAFRAPEGWLLEEPRLNSAGTISRLTLQLRPLATEGGGI